MPFERGGETPSFPFGEKRKERTYMNKSVKIWLCIALVLCLISGIGVSAVQTSGGAVKMTEVKWYTTYGYAIDAYLLVPKTATAENPAPGIVCCHGLLNNKEMQDLNYVELARRGYVVLAIDMLSHGDSDIVSVSAVKNASVYEGALFLSHLDCVDKTKIGIEGHSAGGANSNLACTMDNENETRIIAAAFINSTEPTYKDGDGNWTNIYGGRDVGVVAGLYDEFGFVTFKEDGSQRPTPEYIHSPEAQSFLYFGSYDAANPEREAGVIYTEDVDGEEAIRVIYTPSIIHPWSHFCKRSTVATIEFFEKAFGAPNPIPAEDQVWQRKVAFNALGLLGFILFVINAAIAFTGLPFFRSLRAEEPVEPMRIKGAGVAWFWISLLLCAAFGAWSYLPIVIAAKGFPMGPTPLGQAAVFGVSMWAVACGGVALVCMLIAAILGGRDFHPQGLRISFVNLLKTILLAVLVAFSAYLIVFLDDYLFHADFRVWVLAVKAFEPFILRIALPFMLILCGFYVLNSVAVNSFNFCQVGGKLNIVILAFFNCLPTLILIYLQYSYFKATGIIRWAATNGPMHLYLVWLFPLVAILPISAIISRRIFVKTRNPYLGGLINAIIVALISCANTVSYL